MSDLHGDGTGRMASAVEEQVGLIYSPPEIRLEDSILPEQTEVAASATFRHSRHHVSRMLAISSCRRGYVLCVL